MVGVAYRGHIPLDDIAIEFEVGASSGGGTPRIGVWKTITVRGELTDEHLVRLKRASEFCPVGQDFSKRISTFDDRVEFVAGGSERRKHNNAQPPTVGADRNSAALIFPPGKVRSRHLRQTQEWGEDGGKRILVHEGEVNVYFSYEGSNRPHRWAVLGGHTSQRWGPSPVDFHNGMLAVSVVATLRRLVAPEPVGYEDLAVIIETEAHGGTGRVNVQLAAAEGKVRQQRRVIRTVVAGGPLREVPADTIYAALKSDPMYRFIQEGDILLGEQMVHTSLG